VGAAGVIELRPQLAVSPQEPIEKSQPFSVPFRINNTGYFSFHVDHVFCYISKIVAAGYTDTSSTSHHPDWNNFELDRSESKTIITGLLHAPNVPTTADIAIVVDVRPFRWFPRSSRRYFRFTGGYIDTWQWLAQPSEPIQADADKTIEEHMRLIPSSR
jgi:hypothetical protein